MLMFSWFDVAYDVSRITHNVRFLTNTVALNTSLTDEKFSKSSRIISVPIYWILAKICFSNKQVETQLSWLTFNFEASEIKREMVYLTDDVIGP